MLKNKTLISIFHHDGTQVGISYLGMIGRLPLFLSPTRRKSQDDKDFSLSNIRVHTKICFEN